MIVGIGSDICSVSRIRKALEDKRFEMKIFTAHEREYLLKKHDPAISASGLFAAKEAVSKALGTGFSGFSHTDIEIIHNSLGKPEVSLSKNANLVLRSIGGGKVHVSISHDGDYAAAFAVAES